MSLAASAMTLGMKMFALPIRTIVSVRRHGLLNAARLGWLAAQGGYREWSLGIRTQGSIDGRQLGAGPDSFGYQPIPYNSFDVAMRCVPIVPGRDVFVDYGCGMGRAIILAARRPFRGVIGVERSSELCAVARNNITRARRKLQCPNVQVVNSDAQDYLVPDDATVFFLFNPFGESTVRCVLQRILESLERNPRKLTIVYALPKCCGDPLDEQPWLTLKHDLKTVHADWQRLAIYATDEPLPSESPLPGGRGLPHGPSATRGASVANAECTRPDPQPPAESIQIQLQRCDQLTAADWNAWTRFQEQDPALESPFFRPEFTRVLASVQDVEIAVLKSAGKTVGFFPFQRRGHNVAQPVGGRISDYQGVISQLGLNWDAEVLIRGCDLLAWDFDHLLCSQQPFRDHHHLTDLSPYLDLGDGFTAYRESLRKSGADELKQTLRKARKLQREVGKLTFSADSKDPRLLAQLIEWKSRQYRRTRVHDVFAESWTTRVLEATLQQNQTSFAGVMSVLYVADKPLAIHMGMRAHGVLHWWFPAYDPQFSAYSPGRILLAELAQAAQSLGVKKIDLGRGVAPYKARAMSGSVAVAEGSVDLRPLARLLRERWRCTRDWVRSSALHGPARAPRQLIYQIRDWLASK